MVVGEANLLVESMDSYLKDQSKSKASYPFLRSTALNSENEMLADIPEMPNAGEVGRQNARRRHWLQSPKPQKKMLAGKARTLNGVAGWQTRTEN